MNQLQLCDKSDRFSLTVERSGKMVDIELKDFMKEFLLSDSQLQEVYKRFCNEIGKGLAKDTHEQANTKCFPTYVHELPTGMEIGKYLALDLGGTNFRVLLVTLKGHHDANVESKIFVVPKDIMLGPGIQLFDHIAECLAEFVEEQGVREARLPLGFTFSFPCEQLGLTKAVLARWTKGFQCDGVEQEDVGRLLHEAIERRNDLEIDVVAILNDTTGTLMSCAHRNSECRVGVIIGTGCNACYVERVECAELLEDEVKRKHDNVIINTEWGAFGESGQLEFIRTSYDREVDSTTLNPNKQIFEKLISGMYLGRLVRLVLIKALERDMIFKLNSNRAALITLLNDNIDCFETKFISDIESDNFPEFANTRSILSDLLRVDRASVEDCQKLRFICECIAKRAAILVSIAISGLVNRVNENKVVVGVDGSVYRFHPKFDAYMRETMRKFVRTNIQFDIMLSEDGSGRGAALVAAVASNASK